MEELRYRFAILNGFDRCGGSMIARVLSEHPRVELIFQPFSRTVLHETQWEAWPPDRPCPEVESFVGGLIAGRLDRGFVRSDWFANHSSVLEPVDGQLHVIKSTKLHFKAPWFRSRWPEIPFFGIHRDPRAILCSLARNRFHETWYGDAAFEATRRFVDSDRSLVDRYGRYVAEATTDLAKMAVILAVRTDVMARALAPDEWIVYEEVLADPNGVLNGFVSRFGLERFDFSSVINRDHNVIGKPFEGADIWKGFFTREQLDRVEPILFAWPGAAELMEGMS